ncbi:hypothetical protein OSB04_019607 [Centaurea solstitialis]|uniref:HAT C-terminal dimerisation domain-containing protein n=1 Tax=Centaurea solstitialis TaxID=347529 RepID=A0AA38SQN1_9ASTR|nr:hypothetical protein OSB04_019607 [Centaurea solstitialis]
MTFYNSLGSFQSKRSRTTSPTSELGNYISTDFISNMSFEQYFSLDVLAWWKEKEGQFSVLAAMARDLLTVQASTGYFVKRSRLTVESVACCVCLKDYLDGAVRQQHMTTLEEPFIIDGGVEFETIIHAVEVEEHLSPPDDDDNENENENEYE